MEATTPTILKISQRDPLHGPIRTCAQVADEMRRRHGVKLTRTGVHEIETRALHKLAAALKEWA